MLAFTNTKLTKDQLLARLQSHYDADEIIKGQYWQDGRGCAVGCAIHGSNPAPRWFGHQFRERDFTFA